MFEHLESRKLFSIGVVDGTLTVRGTSGPEKMYVAWNKTSATTWTLRVSDGRKVETWGYSGRNSWDRISIYGSNGNDYLSAAGTIAGFTNTYDVPVPVTLNGGAGEDRLHGSESIDVLFGGSGDDWLFGHGGGDDIFGESGRDSVDGGSGNDRIEGGNDDDTLFGDTGRDTLFGNSGNDEIDAGDGDDVASGNAGVDVLFAGNSNGQRFFRGPNDDFDQDTLYGSAKGLPDDLGDELFY